MRLAYVSGQQGGAAVGDIRGSGTHNQGPDCSHYGVLRGRFITGLDSGDSLGLLRWCGTPVFRRSLNAEMTDVERKFYHCLWTYKLRI